MTEAILEHGGEAQVSRDNFVTLTAAQQNDVLAFLNNQVLFTLPRRGRVIAVRRPMLLAAGTAVLASGWLLWQSVSGGPTVSPVPQPAPRVTRPSTWRGRDRHRPVATDSRSVPRLTEVSRAAGVGARSAGDPARGGGAGSAPAARGLFPLGAGEEPAPDPVVAAREDRLRARVETLRQAFPGVRMVFADCSAQNGEGCLARVESTNPAEINRFAETARQAPGLAAVRVREHLTAMNGVVWHADLEPATIPEAVVAWAPSRGPLPEVVHADAFFA